MNKFTVLLNQLIDESGFTQTKIALETGIGRTKLNRALSGKRHLTFLELEALMDFLNLSIQQQGLLKVAFMRRNLTDSQLQNHARIDAMLSNIMELARIKQNQIIVTSMVQVAIDAKLIRGKINVVTTIIRAIRSQNPLKDKIYVTLNMPLEDPVLRQFFVELLFDSDNHYHIDHIVPINVEDSLVNEEFNATNILGTVIPLKFFGKNNYHCYYFDAFLLKNEFNIFPYYIIMDEIALFVAGDLSCMRIEQDREIIRYYKKITSIHKLGAQRLIKMARQLPVNQYEYVFSDNPQLVEREACLAGCAIYNIHSNMTYHLDSIDQPQGSDQNRIHLANHFNVYISPTAVVFSFGNKQFDYYQIENQNFVANVRDFAKNSTINL